MKPLTEPVCNRKQGHTSHAAVQQARGAEGENWALLGSGGWRWRRPRCARSRPQGWTPSVRRPQRACPPSATRPGGSARGAAMRLPWSASVAPLAMARFLGTAQIAIRVCRIEHWTVMAKMMQMAPCCFMLNSDNDQRGNRVCRCLGLRKAPSR